MGSLSSSICCCLKDSESEPDDNSANQAPAVRITLKDPLKFNSDNFSKVLPRQRVTEIQKFAERVREKSLGQRKLLEERFIQSNSHHPKFLVAAQWSIAYNHFLKSSTAAIPGSVNNSILLINNNLRSDIVEGQDYYQVSEVIWVYIKQLYGGGPDIEKSTILAAIHIHPVRLKNPKYLCYLNTAIHHLASIPELCHYLIKKTGEKKKLRTKKATKWLGYILKEMTENDGKVLNLSNYNILSHIFSPKSQHDCQEYIRHLFTMIQEQAKVSKKLKTRGFQLSISQHAQEIYLRSHTSIVDLLFYGQLSTYIKCQSCKGETVTHDPFLELPLKTIESNLNTSLQHFFYPQNFAEETYDCQNCLEKRPFISQSYLTRIPLYLIITLKGSHQKQPIKYPAQLDLSKYSLQMEMSRTKYTIHSIIVHRGTSESGHYYCISLRGSKWYKFNDQNVTEINLNDHLSQEGAYVILYKRVITHEIQ